MTVYEGFDDDDVRFDRLVDGELNPTEYEQLLASMDDRPDGWRRLALTFLEGQAWCRELNGIYEVPEEQSRRAVRPTSLNWIPLMLAAAASFSLAFWLGLAWNGATGKSGPPQIVDSTNSPGGGPRDFPSNRDATDQVPPSSAGPSGTGPSGMGPPGMGPPGMGPWGRVTLVMDRDDGSSDEIEVPVYRWGDARTGSAFARSMAVPVELRDALQRAGYQIRREVRWTPLEVDGGSRVFVPLGEVEIIPAASRAY